MGVRAPPSGGLGESREFPEKHAGPGTRGARVGHRRSQFPARSLSPCSYVYGRLFPWSPGHAGLDLPSRGGLVPPHRRVQVLAAGWEGSPPSSRGHCPPATHGPFAKASGAACAPPPPPRRSASPAPLWAGANASLLPSPDLKPRPSPGASTSGHRETAPSAPPPQHGPCPFPQSAFHVSVFSSWGHGPSVPCKPLSALADSPAPALSSCLPGRGRGHLPKDPRSFPSSRPAPAQLSRKSRLIRPEPLTLCMGSAALGVPPNPTSLHPACLGPWALPLPRGPSPRTPGTTRPRRPCSHPRSCEELPDPPGNLTVGPSVLLLCTFLYLHDNTSHSAIATYTDGVVIFYNEMVVAVVCFYYTVLGTHSVFVTRVCRLPPAPHDCDPGERRG